jgi:nucleoid DNA-binding protein
LHRERATRHASPGEPHAYKLSQPGPSPQATEIVVIFNIQKRSWSQPLLEVPFWPGHSPGPGNALDFSAKKARMRLKDLNDGIATTCNVRPNVVSSIQAETFKQLRAALDKGEKVIVPEFGQFVVRDVPAEGDKPARKIIKFRAKSGEEKAKEEGRKKGGRKNKNEGAGKPDTAPNEDGNK